jgi:hypothetical protein
MSSLTISEAIDLVRGADKRIFEILASGNILALAQAYWPDLVSSFW